MSWYAEVILSYIIIEKQSDMERRHGSPHIIYKPFFFSLTTFQMSLSPSPMRRFGEIVTVMAGKKTKKKIKRRRREGNVRLLGYLSRKNACGWYVASKSPSITPFKLIHSCSGKKKKKKKRMNESLSGFEVDLKRGFFFLFSPYSVAPRG